MKAKTYNELESHLDAIERESWIFFDIDFTLIEPVDNDLKMVSVFKYSDTYKRFFQDKKAEEIDEALARMMLQYETALVDQNLPNLIQRLEKNHYIYGFTGMLTGAIDKKGKLCTSMREEALSQKGIVFKGNTIFSKDYVFNDMYAYYNSRPQVKNNIIYSNGEKGPYAKAEVLAEFFKVFKIKPKRIVVIEDRLKNLKSIEKMLHKLFGSSVEFIGIHYTQSWCSGVPCLTEALYLKKLNTLLG